MAKSPWKLLTGLFSRREPVEEGAVDKAGMSDTLEAIEAHDALSALPAPRTRAEPELKPATEPLVIENADSAGVVGRNEPPLQSATDAPDPTDAGPSETLDVGAPAPVKGARRRGRSTPAQSKDVENNSARTDEQATASVLTALDPAPEIDPVRMLEDEIRQLRGELSSKLRLQNDQLRQMLKRFGTN